MARRPPQVARGAQAVLAVKRHSATGTGAGDETPPSPAHNTDTLRGITSTRVGRNIEATAPTGTPTKKVEDTRTGTKKEHTDWIGKRALPPTKRKYESGE